MIISPSPNIDSTFTSAANTLAVELPAEIKAECDRILGPDPDPRERWAMYDVAQTWHKNMTAEPPDGDKLYELTHDMTAEYVELNQHERDCDCPKCSGEPEGQQ